MKMNFSTFFFKIVLKANPAHRTKQRKQRGQKMPIQREPGVLVHQTVYGEKSVHNGMLFLTNLFHFNLGNFEALLRIQGKLHGQDLQKCGVKYLHHRKNRIFFHIRQIQQADCCHKLFAPNNLVTFFL